MQFDRLKELVRKLGGVLVLDGDKPEFVILSYDKYENMEAGEEVPLSTGRNGLAQPNGIAVRGIRDEDEQQAVERLNQEISVLKEEIRQKEEAELGEQVSN
jgi:PHD/YefM family antitoxin component YafN of YafNO toxin-antitoxin module